MGLLPLLLCALPAAVQAQFTFVTNNGAITITGYTGPGGGVTIPSTTNGLPVTRIGNSAFSSKTTLTSITIPNTVTNIGTSAFYGCTSLTNAALGSGARSIGQGAFENCSKLASIVIPDSVTSLGWRAFRNCTSLTDAVIGSGVTSFAAEVFVGCTSLASVTISYGVTGIGTSAFYGCTRLASITIPGSVNSIGDSAFSGCTSLASVTISSGVTGIATSAFSGCIKLSSITIPGSVISIGNSAFYGCTSLTNASLDSGVISIGQGAFENCSKLASIVIPDSVTSLGWRAFRNCTSLTDAVIGSGVTSFAAEVFVGCTSLASVTISYGVTGIGTSAFYGCTRLASITIPGSVNTIGDSAFYGCTSLASVTIINGVRVIGTSAFNGCIKLASITIPGSVNSIGTSAFYGCTSLTNASLGSGVLSIGQGAFENCSKLAGIVIPDSVTSLGWRAFRNCTSLTDAVIGSGVTSFAAEVFVGCTSLANVTISDGVTGIGTSAFYGCTKLASVTIPGSVSSIGNSAFYGCTSLTSVVIGSGVTSIGGYAFYNCTRLIGVYFQGNAPSLGGSWVFYSADNATVYYLPGTTGWGPTFGGLPTALWNPQVPVAPTVTVHPRSGAVQAGANFTFSVTAVGTPPLNYQWRKNGVNIVGETSSTLALGVAGSWSAGIYSVVVSNPYGSKTSDGAQLTVSSPWILMETTRIPTVDMSTPAVLVSCPTSPSQLKTFAGGSFISGGTLAPDKMTIVLTHGWIPVSFAGGIGDWPTKMAQTLVSHGVDANIVAWDWGCTATSFPCNPGKAAEQTKTQGKALGQALAAALGANYSREIHFIGSSLGTLVNAPAADHLHSHDFDWSKTHMTLFDEAEIATDTACWRMLALALYRSPSDTQDCRQPLPEKFFSADNYVSLVGRLQPKAANVILTKGLPSSASSLWSFIVAAKDFHAYPISWYSNTIVSPSGPLMGFHWSFEEGGFVGEPAAGTVYVQAFNTSDLDLVQLNTYDEGTDLLNQRFQKYHTTVYANLAQAIASGMGFGGVSGQLMYYAVDRVGTQVQLWTSPPVGPLSPNRSPHPLDPEPNDAGGTNVPAYVWIPITIPSNAVSMSFDFLFQGDGQSDSFAAALNGTNVLSVAANLIQTNVMLNSGLIDVSEYSGQQVELFLGIVGGTSTNASITVTNLQFLGFMPPSLQAQLSGNNLVVTWPISEDGYALETSSSLTGTNSWAPVTNLPAIVDFQNTVTNQVSAGSRFYRLRKQ